jgi:hypothetical protein
MSAESPPDTRERWKQTLQHAHEAVEEADSGDLGLIDRNLVEAGTQMLVVATEIRAELRQ